MYDLWVRKTDVSVFLHTTTSFHVLIEFALDNSHLLSWSTGKARQAAYMAVTAERSSTLVLEHSQLKQLSKRVLG